LEVITDGNSREIHSAPFQPRVNRVMHLLWIVTIPGD